MSIDPTPSFVARALLLALRTLHIALPAAIIAVVSVVGIGDVLDGSAALGDRLLGASWLLGAAALLGWAVGAVCWRAVLGVALRGPTMRGRRSAAVLGILFAVASLLILPALFIFWSLWLAIPLAMIEGLPLPLALSEARRRAHAIPLNVRVFILIGAAVPFALAAMPPFIASFYVHSEWGGFWIIGLRILSGLIALVLSIAWFIACGGAIYADLAQRPPDAEHLAELFT